MITSALKAGAERRAIWSCLNVDGPLESCGIEIKQIAGTFALKSLELKSSLEFYLISKNVCLKILRPLPKKLEIANFSRICLQVTQLFFVG